MARVVAVSRPMHPRPLLRTFAIAGLFAAAGWGSLNGAIKKAEPSRREVTVKLALRFPERYAETPGLVDRILPQPLVDREQLTALELKEVFDAARAPFKHRDAKPEPIAGAFAPQALRGKSQGIMLWGPYKELPAGKYLVVYRFQVLETSKVGSALFFDVARDACTRTGAKVPVGKNATGTWHEIALPVEVGPDMPLEFRFWPDGNTVALDRVYVFQETYKPNAKPKISPDLNLPYGEPVAGKPDVVTSPHTEDEGRIDVRGLDKGTAVRCPYTGKYFRVP